MKKESFEKIAAGGKENLDELSPMSSHIEAWQKRRREDWLFFAVFTFIMLDSVLFAVVGNIYVPLSLCFLQVISLAVLILKNGVGNSLKFVNGFLNRIIMIGYENPSEVRKGEEIPFSQASEQEDPEQKLQDLKQASRQDWFIFIVLNLIFLDVIFFSVFNTWSASVCLLVLEGFILFVLGGKMDMPAICELINKLLGSAAEKVK